MAWRAWLPVLAPVVLGFHYCGEVLGRTVVKQTGSDLPASHQALPSAVRTTWEALQQQAQLQAHG